MPNVAAILQHAKAQAELVRLEQKHREDLHRKLDAILSKLDELERLHAELAVTRAELVVSVGHLSRLAQGYGCEDFSAAIDAALAAKGD